MRAPRTTPAATAALLLALIVAVSGCSGIAGTPQPTEDIVVRPVDTSFVYGTDGSSIDTLAATVVTDVQAYWSRAFPRHFGRPWRGIDGGFFSVDTTAVRSKPPPCTAEVADLEGNAFYCASVDAIAWDRAALLPVLREHYGATAVAVVLAHEVGHAVQRRTGTGSTATEGGAHPVLTEAVADCYAGSYLRWVVDDRSEHLRVRKEQLDGALRALTSFRDPIGTPRSDADAHGTAFDRIAAFQDGYRSGPSLCAGMTVRNREFTSEMLAAAPEQGNQPLEELVRSRTAAMRAHFAALVARRGGNWPDPAVRRGPAGCAEARPAAVTYCPRQPAVIVDHRKLADVHYEIGDQASATALASHYAVAALQGLGEPATGAGAGRRVSCLTGAYTGSLFGGTGGRRPLSAGDLDEAVTFLLSSRQAGRDVTGAEAPTGFDRIAAFRTGVRGGAEACGV